MGAVVGRAQSDFRGSPIELGALHFTTDPTMKALKTKCCFASGIIFLAAILSSAGLTRMLAQNLAGDEALSKALIDGEDWQLVADGFGFTDGACADAEGNFYFFDLGK